MKLQPSLTRHQIGFLIFANSQFEGAKILNSLLQMCTVPPKAMLNTPVRNKSILEFKTKMEVMEILKLDDSLDEDAYEGIYNQ